MQNYIIEKDYIERYKVPRQTLRGWRLGIKQVKNGQSYAYDPKLTKGVHWDHVGRTVVYTEEGIKKMEELRK